MTRIYKVEFQLTEFVLDTKKATNKRKANSIVKDNVTLVAKDAGDAISKCLKYATKMYKTYQEKDCPWRYSYSDFTAINSLLLAEA